MLQLVVAQAPAHHMPEIVYATILLNLSLWYSNGGGLVACILTLPWHTLQRPSVHPLASQTPRRLFLSASALSYPSPACAQHEHPNIRSHFSQQGVVALPPPLKHTPKKTKPLENIA